MQTEFLITVEEFCTNYNVEISFISSLQKTGLIEFTNIKNSRFIDSDQLVQLEKFVRLYYDLDINLEGIETINHLLGRIESMQTEIITLSNRLRLYEKNYKYINYSKTRNNENSH
jgi:hypothetical protein